MANTRLREEMFDTALSLHDLGLVDVEVLGEFDASRLPALKPYSAANIKRLRLKAKTSQSVFAAYLNASVSKVQSVGNQRKKTERTSTEAAQYR